MADTSTKVTGGTIEVQSDSRQRVALELMTKIAGKEAGTAASDQLSRDYWLSLYVQCYRATNGESLKSVIFRG